jgi:hypothetical protein
MSRKERVMTTYHMIVRGRNQVAELIELTTAGNMNGWGTRAVMVGKAGFYKLRLKIRIAKLGKLKGGRNKAGFRPQRVTTSGKKKSPYWMISRGTPTA